MVSIDKEIINQVKYLKSRKADLENHNFTLPDTLRIRLLNSFRKNITVTDYLKTQSMIDTMLYLNKPYSSRYNSGLYYADDYVKGKGESWIKISGITNSYYWDMKTSGSFFKIKDGILPSDALAAFFKGPSFPDCANVIQACLYQYIMMKTGIDTFNKIFHNSISQFVLTQWLYDNYSSKSKELPTGNPLDCIFDHIQELNFDNLEHGDIVYIKGVTNYVEKHLCGFAPGWNLFVIRKKKTDEPTFLGFGPDTFKNGPLTYNELRRKLIEFYNYPQSKETLENISKFNRGIEFDSMHDMINHAKVTLAETLANDIKSLDSDIGGLNKIIRVNENKLNDFIQFRLSENTWYNNKIPLIVTSNTILENVVLKCDISSENINNTFENYVPDTFDRQEMLTLMKKFAYNVNITNSTPLGLIISGKPGIGKTHLSISVMKYVTKKVLYIDEHSLKEEYQKNVSELNYESLLQGVDLVILDDLNTLFGIGAKFFQKAIDYVFTYNKAILVSSNSHLDMIYDSLPYYIGYDNPIIKNFHVINDLVSESYRKPWTDTFEGLHNDNKLEILSSYNGIHAAGIVVNESDIDKKKLVTYQVKICKLVDKYKYPVVRIAREPYKNQYVYDLYMHNIEIFDTFIIKVTNSGEAAQLIKLVEKVHNKGAKIIVISNSDYNFRSLVLNELNSFLKKEYKSRRFDRLKNIFPTFF
jgi:DNA replication protein DnaC